MSTRQAGRLAAAAALSLLVVWVCAGLAGAAPGDGESTGPEDAGGRPTGGAALWGNSIMATAQVNGAGQMVIGAAADYCEGWPVVRPVIDGVEAERVTITNTGGFQPYPVGPVLGPGMHRIEMRFDNDLLTNSCDRNAYVGYAAVRQPGTSAARTQNGSPDAPVPGAVTPASGKAKPGPGTTGVPAGTQLRVHDGDLRITRDGAVVDGLDIRGFVTVDADNVTIRNSFIRGRDARRSFSSLVGNFGNHKNLVVEDSTLKADFPSGYIDGIKGSNFTARRLDVSAVVDTALISGNNVTIEDSWFHDTKHVSPWPQSGNETHNDNLQIQGGTNILVRGNVFEGANNAAIQITQDVGRSTGIRIVDNWLSGGGCTVNLAEKGKGPIGATITDNRFGDSRIADCPIIAPTTSVLTTSGNVWEDTGTPAGVRVGV